jgi:hypothetical protein
MEFATDKYGAKTIQADRANVIFWHFALFVTCPRFGRLTLNMPLVRAAREIH